MRRKLAAASALLLIALLALVAIGGGLQRPRGDGYALREHWGGHPAFNEPTGIAVNADFVYVSDARNARIQAFHHDGRWHRDLGVGELRRPMNLSWHAGQLYAADYFRDAIAVFDGDGRLLRWLQPDDGLRSPGGVDVFDDGSLLVADTYGQRVVHFAPDGRVLRQWSDGFNYPTDVAVTPDGGFLVADGYNDRVRQFDAEGRHRRSWGGPFALNIRGPWPGWFATTTSVAVAADGRIAVADYFNDRLQVFSGNGRLLSLIEQQPSGTARHSAMGVDFATDGSLWVTHHALHRVEHWVRRPRGGS